MVEIFTYYTELPPGVNEMTTPCYDGYTVYIDSRLSDERKIQALCHAITHIVENDFSKQDVNAIETEAHSKEAI